MHAITEPCPLCGAEGVSQIKASYIRDGQSLGCTQCGCSVRAYNPNALDKCIELWNRRDGEMKTLRYCEREWQKADAASGVLIGELRAALADARRIIAEVDEYQKRPESGDYGVECACCMGELLDDDREAIARFDEVLARFPLP